MDSISNISPEITLLGYIDSPVPHATAECHDIDPNTPGLIDRVLEQKHFAILRHGFASFRIANIARWLGRQLLRKAHADYLERSQRYVDMSHAKIIYPKNLPPAAREIVIRSTEQSKIAYRELRSLGVLKQNARGVLPEFAETSMVMSGTLQMWWDFFNLRIGPAVHPECQEVAIEILRQLSEVSEIFRKHPKYDVHGQTVT